MLGFKILSTIKSTGSIRNITPTCYQVLMSDIVALTKKNTRGREEQLHGQKRRKRKPSNRVISVYA